MTREHPPWWRGARGEWYVAVQAVLTALVFLGPRTVPFLPAWPAAEAPGWRVAGAALMLVGGGILAACAVRHGRRLTPLPHPQAQARLIASGPYAVVRHPMYAAGILAALGWALLVRGWLTLGYAVLLFLFADRKASREERWLAGKFPDYAEYRRRVRKLIPFLY